MKRLKRILAVLMTGVITMTAVAAQGMAASAATGEYKSWMQGDSRWRNKQLGRSGDSMASIGCVVTSLSMLIVKSGCADEYSFNPGVLCDYLSKNGGFDSTGGIYWGAPTGLVNNFSYVSGGVLSGSQSSKAQQIASYVSQGYYVLVAVNYGGHWVAVDGVNGDNVTMMDPAKSSTNLFGSYNANSVVQIRVFKAGNTVVAPVTTPAVTTLATTQAPAPQTTPAPIATTQATPAETTTTSTTTPAPAQTEAPVTTSNNVPAQTTAPNATTDTVTSTQTTVASKYSKGTYTLLDDMNMRTAPNVNSEKVGLATGALNVPVIETSGDWGKIICNGKIGWINLCYAKKISDNVQYPTGLYATSANLNYRADAGINFDTYGIIPMDTTVTVTEVKNGWGKVTYKGITGWCSMEYLNYYEANSETVAKMADKTIYHKQGDDMRNPSEYMNIAHAYAELEKLIEVKA